MIKLIIDHEPVGQPRAKATSINGMKRMYTPTKTGTGKVHPIVTFRNEAKAAFLKAHGTSFVMLQGPLSVVIYAWFSRPSNERWKTKPTPWYPHAKKPDPDNVGKAVLDAFTGLIWADDNCVSDLIVRKRVCAGDMQPHVEVIIERTGVGFV